MRGLTQEVSLKLDISPPPNQLRPFAEPAEITLSLTNPNGTAIENGSVRIQLDAPAPGRFFSTDFPIVEGTRLVDLSLPILHGKVRWQYLFPIRGDYRFHVEAMTSDSKKTAKAFNITIRERERKWFFLGVFTAALFLAGFVAGRIFTTLTMGPRNKLMLAVLILVAAFAFFNQKGFTQKTKTDEDAANLEIRLGTVGRLSQISWHSTETARKAQPTNLTLKITHLETGKTVFGIDKIPIAEKFLMQFQFTDGDEYRVESVVDLEKGEPIHSKRLVSIVAVEPPLGASIPALAFFIAVIGAGLWAGRRSRYATGVN